jgi:hypothetical protein
MPKFKMTLSAPVLNRKVLNIDVSGMLGRFHCINHVNSRDIAFILKEIHKGESDASVQTNLLLKNKAKLLV